MAKWQVYWRDNDRQKRILQRELQYHQAVKLWQQSNNVYSFCDYEVQPWT